VKGGCAFDHPLSAITERDFSWNEFLVVGINEDKTIDGYSEAFQ
jgi:hypothetical protein